MRTIRTLLLALPCGACVFNQPVKQPSHEAFSQLAPLFQGAHFLPVDLASLSGWPIASNRHFKYVARKIMDLKLKEAFYFFELDNTPMATGWLDRLQNEYIDANKPYMGHVCPTRGYLHQPDGTVVPQEGEPHMVGTGIYPPNLAAYSVKLSAIDRPSPWTRMPLEPFDIAMRHEVALTLTPPISFNTTGRLVITARRKARLFATTTRVLVRMSPTRSLGTAFPSLSTAAKTTA